MDARCSKPFYDSSAINLGRKNKMVTRMISLVVIFAAIALGALFTQSPKQSSNLTLSRVQTTATTVFPYQAKAGGAQFVEKSGTDSKDAIRVAGAQFVEKSGTDTRAAILLAANLIK